MSSPLRALAVGEGLAGAVMATSPATAVRLACGRSEPPAFWIVRLLGMRMLAQGAVILSRPRADVARAGAAVDALHAVSMIGAAVVAPRYRRAACASAAVAASFAVGAVITSRSTG